MSKKCCKNSSNPQIFLPLDCGTELDLDFKAIYKATSEDSKKGAFDSRFLWDSNKKIVINLNFMPAPEFGNPHKIFNIADIKQEQLERERSVTDSDKNPRTIDDLVSTIDITFETRLESLPLVEKIKTCFNEVLQYTCLKFVYVNDGAGSNETEENLLMNIKEPNSEALLNLTYKSS
jgi:hypothetical protein